jgi:hypothetical protein
MVAIEISTRQTYDLTPLDRLDRLARAEVLPAIDFRDRPRSIAAV